MRKCELCDNEQRYSYSDERNGIGKYDPVFTGGILSIEICEVCLFNHIVEFYPGCAIHKALLDNHDHLSNLTEKESLIDA